MAITMKHVAEKANVSLKTVSRVVNNEKEIAEETRQRVLDTIQEMGYRPNLVARSLVTQRSNIIGLIVPDVCNPYHAEVARGVQEAAREAGYSLMMASSEESETEELHLLRAMDSQAADAVIVTSPVTPDVIHAFGKGEKPIVCINTRYDHPKVGNVLADHYMGATEAVTHLLKAGHTKIAMLAGMEADPKRVRRVRAYRDALLKNNLPFDEALVVRGLPRMHEGTEAARHLLTHHPDITALFCYNDLLALGALRACAELGRRVPQDCVVVGFDDIEYAAITTPSLTTVRVDKRDLGRRAANLALNLLEDTFRGERVIQLPAQLIIRESA